MNQDQKDDFERLKAHYAIAIKTEPAFTDKLAADTVEALEKNNDEDLYHFLRSQRPEARAVRLYLEGLKRRTKDRVKEADRAKKHFDSSTIQNIKNKLGLSQDEPESRVVKELKRLAKKSDSTWKALNLNKKETLKKYGIE